MNLLQLLRASVVRNGQRPCLMYKENGAYRAETYEEVWSKIGRFASALRGLGIQTGDKVAIMAETSPSWMVSDFAIMSLGAVVVPIYPSASNEDAAFILQNAQVRCLIVDHAEQLTSAFLKHMPASVEELIAFHENQSTLPIPIHSFHALISSQPDTPRPQGSASLPDDALATIVHTSGTSGRPKGVMLTHANLVANIEACLSVLPVDASDVALSYLPLSHIFERTVGHFCMLTSGASIAYAESIEKIQQNLREVQPTVLVTVPRLLEKVYAGILQRIESKPKWMQSLLLTPPKNSHSLRYFAQERLIYRKLREGLGGQIRAVVSGGAGLSKSICEFYQLASIPVVEGYGMTETAPVIAVNRLEDSRAGTVGRPVPGVEVRIAEDGELCVKGPNVMSGYYRDDASTRATIDDEGWLHTGDIGELVDGYVRIVDRKKNLLVLATGKNVAPFPIENAITLSPYFADAVLVGDGMKYTACLLVPDFEALKGLAAEIGGTDNDATPTTDNHALVQSVPLRKRLQQELKKALAPFASFEQPKRAVLLTEPFTLESGELTPTLKVRTKIILQKYQQAIEDMYTGKVYLDIFGKAEDGLAATDPDKNDKNDSVPPTAEASSRAENVSPTPPSKPRGKRSLWLTALVLVLLVVGLASAHPKLPANLNLLGTIKSVHRNNDNINQQNGQIVKGMQNVSNLSSLTPKMASQLEGMNSGLTQQNDSLKQLKALSEQEILLSQQFGAVATALNTDLSGISSSTAKQSSLVEGMSSTAQNLKSVAEQTYATNQQIAEKLQNANTETQQVAQEVP